MTATDRIAVVDDSRDIISIVQCVLGHSGFASVAAFDCGADFLRCYRDEANPPPDLVLLDISLPGMSGLQVLEEALQTPRLASTLFVSFSGYMGEEDHGWLGYMGFDASIAKIGFVTEVESVIRDMLSRKDAILAQREPYKNLLAAIRELSQLRLRRAVLENDYIKRLISPEVFEVLDSRPEELAPKHREVSVGFVDIRGFVQMMNRLQINQVDELLKVFFSCVADCVAQEGGFIDKFIGDSVMWFHEAPSERLTAERCLRVAVAVVAGTKELNKRIQERLHVRLPIGVGVGVACGTCAVGVFGSPEHRIQYSALGPPVNLASRLCSEARSGEVLLGGGIIEYCEYQTKKIGFRPVKGFDHEVELRSLVLPRKGRGRNQ